MKNTLNKEQYKEIYKDTETEELLMQLEVFMKDEFQKLAARELLKERGLSEADISRRAREKRLPTIPSKIIDWLLSPIKIISWRWKIAKFEATFEVNSGLKTADQLFSKEVNLKNIRFWHTFSYDYNNQSLQFIFESNGREKFTKSSSKLVLINPRDPSKCILFPLNQLALYSYCFVLFYFFVM